MRLNLILGFANAFLILVIFSCDKNQPIKNFNLEKEIDSLTKTLNPQDSVILNLELCKTFPGIWDSIAILGPYASRKSFDSLSLKSNKSIDEIFDNTYRDNITTLVYINSDKIIGYSTVSRVPLDFSTLKSGNSNEIFILDKSDCNAISLKRIKNTTIIYEVFK